MYSGWPISTGVRCMGIEIILIVLVAFILANIVYYEFAHPKLKDLHRRFREWMYFED